MADRYSKFVDYFVICGLNPSCNLEPDELAGDNFDRSPMERSFKSRVLAHFPDSVPWNPFDRDAISMMCLPHGMRFITQKQKADPYFHAFLITREDGSRYYGFSFTFFEEVIEADICNDLYALQGIYLAEMSQGRSGMKAAALDGAHNSRSLPRHFRLSVHQDELSGSGKYYYDREKDTLFAPKSIALICQTPFARAAREFLVALQKSVMKDLNDHLCIEKLIFPILHEVSIPHPGQSLTWKLPESLPALRLHYPDPACELPLLDFPIREVIELLGTENFLQLFTCLLLENQVLLYSKELYRLMLVAECATAVLFPFMWQHVYVPIVPASLLHFLDAPVPFLMGLHGTHKSQQQAFGECNLCVVYVDKGRVDLPEEIPSFPHQKQLIHEINSILSQYGIQGSLDKNLNERSPAHGRHRRRKPSWNRDAVLQNSDTLQRVQALAAKSGVKTGLEHLCLSDWDPDGSYVKDLKINSAIREVFFNQFIHMFSPYEHFVIQPNQDLDSWLSNRESVQNFDKATFLSDQPLQHFPFMSRFLETQMFTSLIDSKILKSYDQQDDLNVALFDARIRALRDTQEDGLTHRTSYENCTTVEETEELLMRRIQSSEEILCLAAPPLEECKSFQGPCTFFPLPDPEVLSRGAFSITIRKEKGVKRKEEGSGEGVKRREKRRAPPPDSSRPRSMSIKDMSPAVLAQNNWKFVEQLLKECKSRTKRLLVEKLGMEAVELGHGADQSLIGMEENTLIAGLCDLVERIWSHGRQNKQGKSALWSHLLSFQELADPIQGVDPTYLTPELTAEAGDYSGETGTWGRGNTGRSPSAPPTPRSTSRAEGRISFDRRSRGQSPEPSVLRKLPISVTFDMRNVQSMEEIKTPIGYARAWIRLALEKKLLSRHFRELLSNQDLLRGSYKRYAFLRCDDEREQFLYHLLTLNAVDFFCFTNTFHNTVIPYQVIIIPTRKMSASTTTANVWVRIAGTLGETKPIQVPRGSNQMFFQHKNLGILSTLSIGHDDSGMSPNWMVEHVIVRNEVTGHTYKFPCGRWLGRNVDDGSIERLLVGELMPLAANDANIVESCRGPPSRPRSPSVSRRSTVGQLQNMLSDAVNSLVKHFHKAEKERGNLTILLCGDGGLVPSLEQVLGFGFKSSRFFSRNLYLWDYLVRVQAFYITNVKQNKAEGKRPTNPEHYRIIKSFCLLVDRIGKASSTLGKDDRFQLFIVLSVRDHLLSCFLDPLAEAPPTSQMFEEYCFLRDPELREFLQKLLNTLHEFNMVVEGSLTKGIASPSYNCTVMRPPPSPRRKP
ncbi:unnamed protein product [Darwinula stevensoni]|uniref:DENN domain-containing protein 5A n=1 Tax=Darwinula stevensoni TaxID=69355 RepID=A0A7R9A4Q7_9CRUS|nr:unnamed protein product [Darwinula stevensoni]CAG0883869.1 unnamed protein product [Darwinula stevensoni]